MDILTCAIFNKTIMFWHLLKEIYHSLFMDIFSVSFKTGKRNVLITFLIFFHDLCFTEFDLRWFGVLLLFCLSVSAADTGPQLVPPRMLSCSVARNSVLNMINYGSLNGVDLLLYSLYHTWSTYTISICI